ncbi:TetR/AcrR family transcriptional regulator [uncultured Roseovarius sp.]|uniref:TetR/AcrR family transcriptional regulator n=1 Tax=uncultured Roseovarius sp. TaxID=293344 RepID=UPI00262977D0|nr:TetR/AcrR family transcriptional regulator [uncultured Roseovarius sp.]
MSQRKRRTQAERSLETTTSILEATLSCIKDKGLINTSTTEVATRAGVSRGALLHHFQTKELLMAEALRLLLLREAADAERIANSVVEHELTVDQFIDFVWQRFSGDLYMVSMEFVNAARTDPKIKAALVPVAQEFNDAYALIWERIADGSGCAPDKRRQQVEITAIMCLARGMATQTIWRDEPELFRETIDYWKELLKLSRQSRAGEGAA